MSGNADNAEQANRIRNLGKTLDYEAEAIDAVARSWDLKDPTCQALALQDALVWATLNLARVQEGAWKKMLRKNVD